MRDFTEPPLACERPQRSSSPASERLVGESRFLTVRVVFSNLLLWL